jgi:hypothetical protein
MLVDMAKVLEDRHRYPHRQASAAIVIGIDGFYCWCDGETRMYIVRRRIGASYLALQEKFFSPADMHVRWMYWEIYIPSYMVVLCYVRDSKSGQPGANNGFWRTTLPIGLDSKTSSLVRSPRSPILEAQHVVVFPDLCNFAPLYQ